MAQHRRIQLHQMIWCTVFLRLRLRLSHFLPVSVSFPFFPATSSSPWRKHKNNNKAWFFSLSPFIITFSFSLFPTNRSVSPHLSTPPSLFLTRIYLPPSFALSFHRLSLPFSFSVAPHHTYTYMSTALSLKTAALAVYLFRPNTYTHPSNQYFLSCYSRHIFYATSQHPTLLRPLPFSSSPYFSTRPPSFNPLVDHKSYALYLQYLSFLFISHSFLSSPSLFFSLPLFFFHQKDWSGSRNRQTVTKRGESDEDWARNMERRKGGNRGAERESDFRGNIMSAGLC